jgi:hypothetical protein
MVRAARDPLRTSASQQTVPIAAIFSLRAECPLEESQQSLRILRVATRSTEPFNDVALFRDVFLSRDDLPFGLL